MNKLKKTIFAAAVASGVVFSSMGPAWARPSYETCLSMQEECYAGTFDCASFRALCSVYGLD